MSSSLRCWCCWTKWGCCVNLRLYLFVFCVNQRSVRSVFRWFSQWWVLFFLLEVDATPCNGCEMWDHLCCFLEIDFSRVAWRLHGFLHKILRLTHVRAKFSLVVVNAEFPSSFINCPVCVMWKVTFRFLFYEICVANQSEYKIFDAVSGLWHWWFEFNYH